MLRIIMRSALLLAALTVLAGGSRAADAPPKDALNKRLFYVVQYASAKDLADLLGRHFQGAAEFRPLPDPTANALLVNASPAVYDDVVAALHQLDRPRKTVVVEMWIAEAPAPKKEDDTPAFDDKDLSGPASQVAARLEELEKAGAVANLRRAALTTVEGQPESAMLGDTRPFTAGFVHTATGLTSRSITYRNVGTQVRATASVSPDQAVSLALSIEDSRPHAEEGGVPIGTDEKGKPVGAASFMIARWEGKLRIPSGQAQLVQDVQTSSKSNGQRVLLVVAARIIEDAKSEK